MQPATSSSSHTPIVIRIAIHDHAVHTDIAALSILTGGRSRPHIGIVVAGLGISASYIQHRIDEVNHPIDRFAVSSDNGGIF